MIFFVRTVLLFVALFTAVSVGVHYGTSYFVRESRQQDDLVVPTSLGMAVSSSLSQMHTTRGGLVLAGMVAQNRRDWKEAQDSFRQLSEEFGGTPLMDLRLMSLALGGGDYDTALKAAEEIYTDYLSKDPEGGTDRAEEGSFDLARLVLIARAVSDKDYARAATLTDELHSGPLSDFTAPIIRAWLDTANPDTVYTADVSGLSGIQTVHKALAAEYAGKPDVAKAVFDTVVRQPVTAQTAEMIAAFYVRHDDKGKAITVLRRALSLFPDNRYVQEAYNALKEGKAYEPPYFAEEHLKGPATGLAMAFHDFGRLMVAERAIDSGLLFARIAAYLDNDLPGVYMTIGDVLTLQEQREDAIAAYAKVRESDVDYTASRIEMADLYSRMGKGEEAVVILEKIADGDAPKKARVFLALGNLYKEDNRFEDAVQAYDKAETLGLSENNGKSPDWLWFLHYFRGVSFDMMDRHDDAEKELYKALELKPDSAIVLNYLGYSYADKGHNLDKALEMISRAVELSPDDGYIVDSMGWVLYRMGQYDAAVEYLERAAQLSPYNSVVNDHLGDAYWQVGRRIEAHYMWQRAIDYMKEATDQNLDADDEEQAKAAAAAAEKLKHGLISQP